MNTAVELAKSFAAELNESERYMPTFKNLLANRVADSNGVNVNLATYTEEYNAFYTAGKEDADIGIFSTEEGILNSDERLTAYKAGQLDAKAEMDQQNKTKGDNQNEQGDVSVRGIGERNDGEDTAVGTWSLAEEAGRAEEVRGSGETEGKYADTEIRDLPKNGKEVTAVNFGLKDGTDERKVRIYVGTLTTAMKNAKEIAKKLGLKVVFFYGNNLSIGEESVRGVFKGDGTVYVRVDHELFTAEEIMKHEYFHGIINSESRGNSQKKKETVDRMWSTLRSAVGEKNAAKLINSYAPQLNKDVNNEEDVYYIKEEILADMYAGMNVFKGFSYHGWVDNIVDLAQIFRDIVSQDQDLKRAANRQRGEPGEEKHSIQILQRGANVVIMDGNLISMEATRQEGYKKLIGTYETDDGTVIEIKESIPGRNLFREVIKRNPKYHPKENIKDINRLNSLINDNLVEILQKSKLHKENVDDVEDRHKKMGIVSFDERRSIIVDGSGAYNLDLTIANMSDGTKVLYAKRYIRRNKTIEAEIRKGSAVERSLKHKSQLATSAKKLTQNNKNVKKNRKKRDHSFKMSSEFEETDRFIAWHNMNEDALSSALELGGLAMPSFAVKAANTAHSDYGPISVIAAKESVTPDGRDQSLFAGDVWTPVFPEVNYKINESETDRIYDHIYSILKNAGVNPSEFHIGLDGSNLLDKLQRNNGSFSKAMQNNDGMKLAFLKDSGIGIEIPSTEKKFSQYASNETLKRIAKEFDLSKLDSDKIRDLEPTLRKLIHEDAKNRKGEKYADLLYPLDQPLDFSKADNILRNAVRISEATNTKEVDTYALKDRIKEIMTPEVEKRYTAWLDTLGKDVISGKGIRNNVDTYTANGNRRSFDQLHYEYNLSNIIRAMRSQPRQGRTQAFSGPGSVKGAAMKNYKDIEAARADMNRLSKKEQIIISEKYTSFNDHVLELSNKVAKDPFTGSEILAEILSHAKTKDQIMHYMIKEYSGVFKATNALTNEIYALGQEANDLPIEYFEAKLYRAFPITEAAAYIVPDNMDQDLRRRLEETGANVLQYEAGNEEDRLKKANSVPEARFSSDFNDTYDNSKRWLTDEDFEEYMNAGSLHDRHRKESLVEEGKSPIIRNRKESDRFIDTAIKGNAMGEVRAFGKVDSRLADAVYEVNSKVDIEGKYLILEADGLRESYKQHSTGKEFGDIDLTEEDFKNIPDAVKEFDYVLSVDKYNGMTRIYLAKETEKGYYQILTVTSNRKEGVVVKKLFGITKEKFAKKYSNVLKRNAGSRSWGQNGNGSNPSTRAHQLEPDSSKSNLHQESQSVNQNFSKDFSPFAGEPSTLTEAREMLKKIEKEKEKYRKQVEYYKGQMQTSVTHLDPKSAERWAGKIVKQYGPDIDKEKVADAFKAAGRIYIDENGKTETAEMERKIRDALYPAVDEIVRHAMIKDQNMKNYESLHKTLRAGIFLSERDRNDIPDYNDFRKKNMGLIKLTQDRAKGQPIDTLWEELQDEFGKSFFPDDITHPADQVQRAVEVLKDLRGMYVNPFQDYDMAEAGQSVEDDLMTSLYSGMIRGTEPTYADKMEARLAEERQKTADRIKKAVEENQKKNDRVIEELKREYKENTKSMARAQRIQDMSERERISQNEKLRRIIKRLRNRKLSAVNRARIDEIVGDLDTMFIRMTGERLTELQALDDYLRDNPDIIVPDRIQREVASGHCKKTLYNSAKP